MKRIHLIAFFILLGFTSQAQVNKYGVPLIVNYTTQITRGSEQTWCIAHDTLGNMYFGNQDQGVIKYDGIHWTRIQINKNPRIFSLASDKRGIIYVGAAFEFGYIQPGPRGEPEYISLSSRLDSIPQINVIYSILVQDNRILFMSPGYLYFYDLEKDSLSKISLRKSGLKDALRLVKINDRLIIADNRKGLFEMKGDQIIPLPGGDFFKNKNCTVILPFDRDDVLIGTFYDGVYLYNYETGQVNSNFIPKSLNQTLRDVSVYAGARIGKDLFAIGTTNTEGVLIFNRAGELVNQINKENSQLADNTITAMFCDYERNSELWISTLGFISKVYVNVPVTQFTEKQGIESGINSICEFQGSIYLSSDAGIQKSTLTSNNSVSFTKVPGINTQVFPLLVLKSQSPGKMLAGSLNGILEISGSAVNRLANDIRGIPQGLSRKLVQSSLDPSVVYIGLESGGVGIIRNTGKSWKYVNRIKNIPGYITGIVEKKEGGIWFSTDDPNALYNVNFSKKDTIVSKYGSDKGLTGFEVNAISSVDGNFFIAAATGIYRYDSENDRFVEDNHLTGEFSKGINSTGLFQDDEKDVWYSGENSSTIEMLFRNTPGGARSSSGYLKLLPNVPEMDIMYSGGRAYILKSKTLFVIDKAGLKNDSSLVNTGFVRITAGSDSVVMSSTFFRNTDRGRRIPVEKSPSQAAQSFGFDMNSMSFEWATPYYLEELLTEYSYKLEGFDKDWSKWQGISFGNTMEAQYPKKEYSRLPYGSYKFRVRTRTLTGLSGNELSYQFTILKPWYATLLAYVVFFLIGFLVIFLIIMAYTRKLKNENIRLEGIVAERTAVVVKQKEELESSIHYASRIQRALLPSEAILSENIRNYFILFKPRDIVSGDFYWMTRNRDRLYIVAADCTGHGVPGAFMSLLGMSFLDEIIEKETSPRADVILRELRLHVIESLKQVGSENETKDGMDIALLVIDFEKGRIEFSGAYNPCFRVRMMNEEELRHKKENHEEAEDADGVMTNGKYILETIYASKMPIGISSRVNENFVFHDWALEKGNSYYLFSDGYIDQFGGPDGRKFMKKNFKRLILDIQEYPMQKQKELLENNLIEWMGHSPQIDDILVMGIRTE